MSSIDPIKFYNFSFFFCHLQMFFHGKDRKSILKHISASCLPANYGGDLPMIDYSAKEWYPSVSDHIEFIANWNTYGFATK